MTNEIKYRIHLTTTTDIKWYAKVVRIDTVKVYHAATGWVQEEVEVPVWKSEVTDIKPAQDAALAYLEKLGYDLGA
jgi:hypothetical protein